MKTALEGFLGKTARQDNPLIAAAVNYARDPYDAIANNRGCSTYIVDCVDPLASSRCFYVFTAPAIAQLNP